MAATVFNIAPQSGNSATHRGIVIYNQVITAGLNIAAKYGRKGKPVTAVAAGTPCITDLIQTAVGLPTGMFGQYFGHHGRNTVAAG